MVLSSNYTNNVDVDLFSRGKITKFALIHLKSVRISFWKQFPNSAKFKSGFMVLHPLMQVKVKC